MRRIAAAGRMSHACRAPVACPDDGRAAARSRHSKQWADERNLPLPDCPRHLPGGRPGGGPAGSLERSAYSHRSGSRDSVRQRRPQLGVLQRRRPDQSNGHRGPGFHSVSGRVLHQPGTPAGGGAAGRWIGHMGRAPYGRDHLPRPVGSASMAAGKPPRSPSCVASRCSPISPPPWKSKARPTTRWPFC